MQNPKEQGKKQLDFASFFKKSHKISAKMPPFGMFPVVSEAVVVV
jgi:hypothetical protein